MAIELPELIQRVRVDYSDLARAERAIKASGRTNDDAAASVRRLGDANEDAASAADGLGESQGRQARSGDRAALAGRRLADTVRSVRDATEDARVATDRLGQTELRLQVAQKGVEVAQGRLNRARDEGRQGTLEYQRAELAVIDALRRVARVQDDAARSAARAASSNDSSRASLVRFARDARRAGDAGRFLSVGMSAIKVPALVTGLTLAATAVSALGAGSVALVGQLAPAVEGVGTAAVAAAAQFGPLAGALASLPATVLAVKGSVGVFKTLTEGPQKAAEAIRKYGAASEQAKSALAGLSPQARGFAHELADLAGRLETIRRAGQVAALPGLTRALDRASVLLPVVRAGFVGVARSLSQVAQEGADAFTTPAFRRDLGLIAVRNAALVRTLGGAAVSLASALKGVVLAAGPMTQAFADAGAGVAETTDRFVNSAAGQRRLVTFLNTTTRVAFSTGRALRDLAAAALDVGRAVSRGIGTDMVGGLEDGAARLREFVGRADVLRRIELFSGRTFRALLQFSRTVRDITVGLVNLGSIGARAIGIDFAGGLEQAARDFRAFTESVEGSDKIAGFFSDARPVLVETGRLIRDVGKAFASFAGNSDLAPVLAQIRTELLPALVDLAGIAGRLGPTLVDLATAFVKFNEVLSFSPIILVAGAMAKLVIAISDVARVVPGLSTVIASLVALRLAALGVATVGKFTGITGLVTAIGAAGPAGTAGQRGLAGFVQGLKGVNVEAAKTVTLVNRAGGSLRGLAGGAGVGGATATVGRFGGALRGITGALGGPWGIAVGAGIGLLFHFAQRNAEAKARVDALRDSLDQQTGAITENTRTQAANTLLKKGLLEDAQRLGISLRDLTDATLGNEGATARVRARMTELQDTLKAQVAAGKATAADYFEQREAINKLADAIGGGTAETRKAQEEQRLLAEAGIVATDAQDGLSTSMTGVGDAAIYATSTTKATRAAFIRAAIEAGNTRKAAKKLADALKLIPPEKNIAIGLTGDAAAIARIAALREAITGIPATVTIGILNKVAGAGGDLGSAVPDNSSSVGTSRVNPRTAEREATAAVAKAAKKAADVGGDVGETAGATAGDAAGKAFSNQFVKTAGGDLTKAGQRLVDNLVDALTGSQQRIRTTTRNLRELIHGAFSGDAEDRFIEMVRNRNRKLLELARQRDAIRDKIKAARDEIINGAAQSGAGLRDAIAGSGNVTGPGTQAAVLDAEGNDTGRTTTNVLRIIGNLRAKVAATKAFTRDLRELKRRGVNVDTLRQLIEAGPEEGGPAARALAAATDEQLREVNSLQGTLTTAGTKAGTFAEETLKTLGLQSIQGLLAGLREGEGEVEDQMTRLARIMRRALRRELGINSPSTAMAQDARFTVDGYTGYLMGEGRRRVAEAGRRLGESVIPGAIASGPATTVPASAAATTVNGDRIGTQIVIQRLEMVAHNPVPEPFAETTAPENLRKVAAVLSR